MIEPPWWLVILPLAATPLVYFSRRWAASPLLAALVALLTGWLAWSLPPTNPFRLMGRTLLLDPLTQQVLALLFVISALLFLAGWWLKQGPYFPSLGLVALALLSIAGMSRHLGVTALLMTLAAIVTVPIIQADQTGNVRAAWRFLTMMFIALPFFLLVAWRVDMFREDPENIVYLGQTAIFLAAGMAIWLAVVPLHGWLTATGIQAPPVASAFVLTAFPLMALVSFSHVLVEAPWFTWSQQASQLLLMAGLLSAGVGGLFAVAQRSLRGLMGYAALFDLGCLLIAFAVRQPDGGATFYALVVTRAIGLALTGTASAIIGFRTGSDNFSELQNTTKRLPLATAALLVGGFTLVGLPLSAGFAPRWFLFRNLAEIDTRWVWVLAIAGLAVAAGYLLALKTLVTAPKKASRETGSPHALLVTVLTAGLGILTLALGLFPTPLLRLASQLASLYPLPYP